jgi:hypothetical protein
LLKGNVSKYVKEWFCRFKTKMKLSNFQIQLSVGKILLSVNKLKNL